MSYAASDIITVSYNLKGTLENSKVHLKNQELLHIYITWSAIYVLKGQGNLPMQSASSEYLQRKDINVVKIANGNIITTELQQFFY